MSPLFLSPSEAVVLRHALMSYRNGIAERNRESAPYPMTDGFELVAADMLVARLDMMSEGLLTDDRQRAVTDPSHLDPDPLTVPLPAEPVRTNPGCWSLLVVVLLAWWRRG